MPSKTAHPSYSNFTGFRFLNWSNTKLHVPCVTTQLIVPPLLPFWSTAAVQPFPLCPLFIRLMHTQTLMLQPQNSWLSLFLLFRSSHLEQPPPKCQTLYCSPFLQEQTEDISLLWAFQVSNAVLRPNSPYNVCVCTHLCVCVFVNVFFFLSVCVCVCVYIIIDACTMSSRCVDRHIFFSFFFYDIYYLNVQYICI